MTANPLHTSISKEHYTPTAIIAPARATLEHIDLDPASCEIANQVVQADTWRGQEPGSIGALAYEWHGNVFLNPPGGKLGPDLMPLKAGNGRSSSGVWWAKLMHEWSEDRVESAIFICFSLNVFRAAMTAAPGVRAPYEFPFVIPRKRIQYETINALGARVPGKKCQHDSAIVFVPNGPRGETEWGSYEDAQRFSRAFEHLGPVRL